MAFSLAASTARRHVVRRGTGIRAARQAPVEALHASGRTATSHRSRLGAGLVVGEVALSLMLLVGAGLLLQKLREASARARPDSGPTGLVSMRISLPTMKYADPAAMRAFVDRVVPAIESVPGVASAAASMALPPFVTIDGAVPDRPTVRSGRSPSGRSGSGPASRLPISRRWAFRCWRDGRFTAADDERAPLVAVISEGLARRAWPTESRDRQAHPGRPLSGIRRGRRRRRRREERRPRAQPPWTAGVHAVPAAAVAGDAVCVVRAAGGDPLALVNVVRAAVLSVDRDQPITRGRRRWTSSLSDSVATARFMTMLLLVFATWRW